MTNKEEAKELPGMVKPSAEQIEAANPELSYNADRWPTDAEFADEKTAPGAIAYAAAEILNICIPAHMAAMRVAKSKLPIGSKMAFNKKLRIGVDQLYLGIPNQQKELVMALVVSELMEMFAEGSVDLTGDIGAIGKPADSKSEVAGSSPDVPAMPTYTTGEPL